MSISPTKVSFYQFDVLRAVAIMGVFLVHCQYAIFPDFDLTFNEWTANIPSSQEKYKYLALFPFAYGWTGVMLFFLISGYLIHFTTLKYGIENFNLSQYFNKRFWRIYPPYLIALFIFFVSNKSLNELIGNSTDLISHIFLIHNLNEKYIFSINGVFWSLAAEVQLYILYPVFLYIRSKTSIKTVMVILSIIAAAVTIYWWLYTGFKSISVGNSVLRYWIVWGLGAYLAESYLKKERIFENFPNWLLIILFIIFYFSKILKIHHITDPFFISFIFAVCIEKYLYKQTPANFIEKLIIPIGLCSYSIYLFHMPILNLLFRNLDILKSSFNSYLYLLLNSIPAFLIVYFFSFGFYKLVELKSIELGSSLYKKNKK